MFTRTENAFVSLVDNRCEDGCYFHKDGQMLPEGEDGWSGFSSIGLTASGAGTSCTGALIRANTLADNAFIPLRLYRQTSFSEYNSSECIPVILDAIVERNTVRHSFTGLALDAFKPQYRQGADRLLIRGNDFSEDVDRPLAVPQFILEKADIRLEDTGAQV